MKGEIWLSAQELAELGKAGVIRFPASERGARYRAKNEGWQSRDVPGRGGPKGTRTEYCVPESIRLAISQHPAKSSAFSQHRETAAPPSVPEADRLYNNRVGELLKNLLRLKTGSTQEALASAAGVMPEVVRSWLQGSDTPKGAEWRKVTEFFDIPQEIAPPYKTPLPDALPALEFPFQPVGAEPVADQRTFSLDNLLYLQLPGLPTTKAALLALVQRDNWPHQDTPCQPGSMFCYRTYTPPTHIQSLVDAWWQDLLREPQTIDRLPHLNTAQAKQSALRERQFIIWVTSTLARRQEEWAGLTPAQQLEAPERIYQVLKAGHPHRELLGLVDKDAIIDAAIRLVLLLIKDEETRPSKPTSPE